MHLNANKFLLDGLGGPSPAMSGAMPKETIQNIFMCINVFRTVEGKCIFYYFLLYKFQNGRNEIDHHFIL